MNHADAGCGRHAAIADYNERINAHPRLTTAIVPLRDGVAISVKRVRIETMSIEKLARRPQSHDAERRGLP